MSKYTREHATSNVPLAGTGHKHFKSTHRAKFSASRKPMTRRPKAPKPIPAPKPIRPKRGYLRRVYRDLISVDRDQRINALEKAMAWFDAAWVYVKDRQGHLESKEQLKLVESALAVRIKGMGPVASDKKEECFLQFIHLSEQLVNGFKPPKIDSYLSILQVKGEKLRERKEKLKDRYGAFLELMEKALQPKNAYDKRIRLRVDRTNATYRISSEGNITFDRKAVQNMRRLSRKEGILAGVIQLMPILAEARCRIPEMDPEQRPTGKYDLRKDRWWISDGEILNQLLRYSLSEQGPKKLVRRPKPKVDKPEEVSS